MCRWLELLAEFDRREGWGTWDCRSCAEWVAWRCALDPRSAREHVRVGRALEDLPQIRAAFRRGQLSYSKVRALTRVANDRSEGDLLELAEHSTAAQLDRIVRGMRHMTTADANEALRKRHLSLWWEADGSLSINANLPAEEGAAFARALDAMHDLLRERDAGDDASKGPDAEPGSAEPPQEPHERRSATNADALAAMAESALVGPGESRTGGERYEIVVHVDANALMSLGSAKVVDGSPLAPETARRLACDSSVVAMIDDADGSPLSVGRKTRSVPPSLSRALRARDSTCAFPGCENRRFLDAHHIRHWAHGGETSSDNLVLLCRRHHRLVHEGGYRPVRDNSGTVSITQGEGDPVDPSPVAPEGGADALVRLAKRLHVASVAPHPGTGERLDLDWVLSALSSRSP